MFLIPHENMSLVFESGGYISENFKGRIVLKLANYSSKIIQLQSGTPIGYLVLQPFSLEWNLKIVKYFYLSFMKCVSLCYFYYLLYLLFIVHIIFCEKINDRENFWLLWKLCKHWNYSMKLENQSKLNIFENGKAILYTLWITKIKKEVAKFRSSEVQSNLC